MCNELVSSGQNWRAADYIWESLNYSELILCEWESLDHTEGLAWILFLL